MKVLYVDPQSSGNMCIYDKSLIANLDNAFSVVYLCNQHFSGVFDRDNVTVKVSFCYNESHGIKKVLSYLKSLWFVYKETKRCKPNIIHVQWIRIYALESRFYVWLAKRCEAKLVFTAHNILPHDTGTRYFNSFKRLYMGVDAIVVHDKKTQKELSEQFNINKDKLAVIPHGLLDYHIAEDTIQKEIESLCDELGIKEDTIVFSSLGNQEYYKGVDVLLDVWLSNKELFENSKCVLIIAGRNKDIDLTKAAAANNIYIDNRLVPDERLVAIMKRSDVVVLPYRKISQSGVLMLAIACGTPMLVTDIGGLADPQSIGNVGWKIKECDYELLSNQILQLIQDPVAVNEKKISNNAEWKKVQSEYSWSSIGQQTSKLYYSLFK